MREQEELVHELHNAYDVLKACQEEGFSEKQLKALRSKIKTIEWVLTNQKKLNNFEEHEQDGL